MIIEVSTFALADGADTDAFVAADAALQRDLMLHSPGLLRRTVGRNDVGWVAVTLWETLDDAVASEERVRSSAAGAAYLELVDASSVRGGRYEDLGG